MKGDGMNIDYFRGVGIGLLISWVTGALAYWKTGQLPLSLLVLECALSVIFLAISFFMQ
ncbi:Uncharacterised protein [Candidatus Gugararchaeum adminiculabundum]|nr:Uncharacterised protein [Candidatus Gugararchaeum adminiculabundum]